MLNTAAVLEDMPQIFNGPDRIVEIMLDLNERIFQERSFNELSIKKLGEPPECPESDDKHLYCHMLFPGFEESGSAFALFWEAFLHTHRSAIRWPQLELDNVHLVIRDQAHVRPRGPSWAIVELGRRTKGKCVEDAIRIIKSAGEMPLGPELPLIGAVHPEWAESMDGKTVPYLYAGDIEVGFGTHKPCGFVPYLSRSMVSTDFVLHVENVFSCCSLFGTGSIRYERTRE